MARSSKQQITSHGRFLFYKSIFTTKLSFSNIFHTNYANVAQLLKPFTFNYNNENNPKNNRKVMLIANNKQV